MGGGVRFWWRRNSIGIPTKRIKTHYIGTNAGGGRKKQRKEKREKERKREREREREKKREKNERRRRRRGRRRRGGGDHPRGVKENQERETDEEE